MEELESWLNKRIESVDKTYEREVGKYYDESIGSLNLSALNKKEKESLINTRNCLLVQKAVYNEVLDKIKNDLKGEDEN